jgi:hypothetical protein
MRLRAGSDDIEMVVEQIGRKIEGLPAGDADVTAVDVPTGLDVADCITDVGSGWHDDVNVNDGLRGQARHRRAAHMFDHRLTADEKGL